MKRALCISENCSVWKENSFLTKRYRGWLGGMAREREEARKGDRKVEVWSKQGEDRGGLFHPGKVWQCSKDLMALVLLFNSIVGLKCPPVLMTLNCAIAGYWSFENVDK